MRFILSSVVVGFVSICSVAHAGEKVLQSRFLNLPVSLSEQTVLMIAADYSRPLVKVLMPALADVTFLNHRNGVAGAPCLATVDTNDIGSVLQNRPATEVARVHVSLVRSTTIDNGVCHVAMVENIQTSIRGFTFKHSRAQEMPDRAVEDCRD